MKCKVCNGKGKLKTYSKGKKSYVKCELCSGTGDVEGYMLLSDFYKFFPDRIRGEIKNGSVVKGET